jgi:hypothetical protein
MRAARRVASYLALFALVVGLGWSAEPTAAQVPIVGLRHSTSSNWGGYAVTGAAGTFTSVSASWTQPAVTCTSQNTWSSYWVGLDGDTTSTVEQLGTDSDCSSGSPRYYAWYEMYPHPSFLIKKTVNAGDSLNASVTYGPSGYTLRIANATQNWSFTTTQKQNSAKRGSAEVIVEAPYSGGILPLANFGTVTFIGALANGQLLSAFSTIDPITLVDPNGGKATPSGYSSGNFSATYSAN